MILLFDILSNSCKFLVKELILPVWIFPSGPAKLELEGQGESLFSVCLIQQRVFSGNKLFLHGVEVPNLKQSEIQVEVNVEGAKVEYMLQAFNSCKQSPISAVIP